MRKSLLKKDKRKLKRGKHKKHDKEEIKERFQQRLRGGESKL